MSIKGDGWGAAVRPRLHSKLHVEPKGAEGDCVQNSLMLGALYHCRDEVLTVVSCILAQQGALLQQPAVVEPVKVKAQLNGLKISVHLLKSEGDVVRGDRHSVRVQATVIAVSSILFIDRGGLLAAQCEVHLVDVVLVKGAEAGGAAVLAVLATLVARPVLREGRVEDGSVEHNSAILSNLSVALKRMDSAEA